MSENYENMSFGNAIECLKLGDKVARKGWNGKGMYLTLVTSWNGNVAPLPEDYKLLPWIAMKTADNGVVPWLASQTDMLTDDWCVFS